MSLKPKVVNFEFVWTELSCTLSAVITCGKVERRIWNDRFSDVYSLCVAQPEPLAEKLYKETKRFLEDHVAYILQDICASGDDCILSAYHRHWEQFSTGSQYMNYLYGYLNQQYVKRTRCSESDKQYSDIPITISNQILEIGELAFDVWKRLLIEPLQKRLVDALLDEIHRDRLHIGTMNHGVIHGVIHSFVTVDEPNSPKCQLVLYRNAFEAPFLEATGSYYQKKASELLNECLCVEYLKKAILLLNEENTRSRKFIHTSSHSLVTKKVEERLASDHLQLLRGECHDLVEQENTEHLANMYALLRPIKGLDHLCEELEAHIRKSGLDAIESLTEENLHQQFVEAMLALHKKYSLLVKETFSNDQQFIAVLDRACASVINHKPNPKQHCRSPELLVRYCDSLLKKSAKEGSEAEIDEKLNNSITVFKYLSDKDIYQGVYQRMLCKRLIFRQSSSMDAEEAMINRLKQTCGYEFTNKLHRMFTDINLSSDLTNRFQDYSKENQIQLKHSFSILVLQAGAWPIASQKLPTFQVPAELEISLQVFEKFYNKKFNGRKLTWIHSHSTGELKLCYLKKEYCVTLGLFQMSILLQFNDSETLTTEDLLERTKLVDKDFPRHVSPLVDSDLLKEQSVPHKDSEKLYKLNMDYSNKRLKFKIMAATVKDTPQEIERVRVSSDEDRKWQIQAAIVRIMKTKKTLAHNLLIQEVIKQLQGRCSPTISIIKKSIEALIEKQYIERAANSKDEYSYVA